MTRIVLAFLIGMCLAAASPATPSPIWLLAALPCLLALRHGWVPVLALALMAGAAWLYVHAHAYLQARDTIALHQEAVWLQGRVQGLPRIKNEQLRFDFAVVDERQELALSTGHYLLAVSWNESPVELQAGDQLRLKLRLRPPRSLANPASFDAERWYMGKRIHGSAWVQDSEALPAAPTHYSLSDRVNHLRQAVARNIRQHIGGVAGAILPALAVADRSGLADQHWRVLSATGTGHLLAISGLHIGLVAGVGFLLGRLLFGLLASTSRQLWRQDIAATAAMSLAVSYSILAGFSLSTIRATVMLAVVLAALALRRRLRASHGLALALIVVLLIDPFAPLKPGFWLSFAAVACLIAGFSGRARGKHQGFSWWRAQVIVFLGLGPIILLLGSELSLLAPLVNLVAIPLTGLLIVPPLLLAVVTMAVAPILTGPLLQVAAMSCELLWWLLSAAARLPIAEIVMNLSWPALLAALIGSALLLCPRGFPARWVGLLALGSAMLSANATGQVATGEVSMHIMDVGQGLSVLVRTRHHALLYDSGPVSRSGWNAGSRVVVPYLKHLGLGGVDLLISSHGDADHAGGIEPLMAWSGQQTMHYSSTTLAGAVPCHQGERWVWDAVRFEFLHPTPFLPYLGNDSSCVLLVTTGNGRFLLPGDISSVVEERLARHFGDQRVEVMIVPHHGSKTSSSEIFLRSFQPRLAVVSSAYRNRFGMPHSEVRARYHAQDIELLNTADCGQLVLTSEKGRGVVVNAAYRRDHRRLWHAVDSCKWRRRVAQK